MSQRHHRRRAGARDGGFQVDDHPVVRKGIVQLIASEPGISVIGEAESAYDGLELIRRLKPDVCVVDLTLKVISGMELIKSERLEDKTRLLVISMHEERVYVERCLRLGAKGYVMKEEAADAIVVAIHKVKAGGTYVSERLMAATVNRMVGGKPESPSKGGMVASLSDRELEVFHLIGRSYTTRAIAEELDLSVKRLRRKRRTSRPNWG